MKVIYDKVTGALLDATHVLIGDIDPYKQTTDEAMIIEVLAQDRPLLQKAAEVDKERKCLHCGGDLLDEEATHCSVACLRKATHIIADDIVNGVTKDLLAMSRDKVDEREDNMLHDPVNHPSHYTAYEGLEVIDLTEQMNFNRGNAVKYICRAGLKDLATEIQDLEKAAWYLSREIARLKERT